MIVHNDTDRATVISKINAIKLTKPWKIDAEPYTADRSTAQNALLNAWYRDIAKHTGEGFAYTRGFMKFTYGVPILLARGEPEFHLLIEAMQEKMTYEQIINLMSGKSVSISSAMNKTEFTDYLTMIEQHCADRQIPLLRGDEYDLAMGIK